MRKAMQDDDKKEEREVVVFIDNNGTDVQDGNDQVQDLFERYRGPIVLRAGGADL